MTKWGLTFRDRISLKVQCDLTRGLQAPQVFPRTVQLCQPFSNRQHILRPVVHYLLETIDMQQDIVQVREQVHFLQIEQVSNAGVQMRAENIIVHTDAAASGAALGDGPGLLPAWNQWGIQVHAARVPVDGGPVRWGQALYGECFGEGSWLVVFGNVDHQVFIGAELIPAVLFCDFIHWSAREDVYVLQIHAAALVVGPVRLALFQAGCADSAATGMAATLAAGVRRQNFVGRYFWSSTISVYDLDTPQRLQSLGLVLQHRSADHQRLTPPSQSSSRAQCLHALQEVFGTDAACLAVLIR